MAVKCGVLEETNMADWMDEQRGVNQGQMDRDDAPEGDYEPDEDEAKFLAAMPRWWREWVGLE
jgi:hypothetical protein